MKKEFWGFAVLLLVVECAPRLAVSATLEVSKGAPVTIDEDVSSTYDSIEAHDILTIADGGNVLTSGSTNWFGQVSGDNGGLRIVSGSGSTVPKITSGSSVNVFSGNLASPALSLSGAFWDKVYLYNIAISAEAVVDGEEIPFAELTYTGSNPTYSSLVMSYLCNHNEKPAVVSFKGGCLRMVAGNAESFRVPEASNKIILRGDADNDVVLTGKGTTYYFPYGDDRGTIATDGECDVQFTVRAKGDSYYVLLRSAYDSGHVVWGHTGETLFTNAKVELEADNALPYSNLEARTIRVADFDGAEAHSAYLDLKGHSAKVGNLYVSGGAYVTNTASAASALVFGADNVNSVFSGVIRGDVTLVKKGTGTLTIADGSVIPTIKLDGSDLSTVVVDGTAEIGAWEISLAPKYDGETTYTIASGKTYDVAPFSCEPEWFWDTAWTNHYYGNTATTGGQGNMANCIPKVLEETGLSNGLHRVSVASGGKAVISVADGDSEKYEYLALSGKGSLEKTGAGTATIIGDDRVSLGGVHVAGGTLKFQGRGCTNEYWRFTVTENGSASTLTFGKIGVFGEFGDWICMGTTLSSTATDATGLAKGEFIYSASAGEASDITGNWNPKRVFTKPYYEYGMKFVGRAANTDTATVTFRLPANSAPAVWHSFSGVSNYEYNPNSWKLETSADGSEWTQVVGVLDQAPPKPEGTSNYWYYRWRNDCRWNGDGGWNEGLPWRIGLDNALASVGSLGTVQVDSSATLDLSAATNAVISSMVADAYGLGGTIIGGSISSTGAINVISDGGQLEAETILISLHGVDGASNIRKWGLTLNGGAQSSRRLEYDTSSGEVRVVSTGIVVVVR